MTNAEPELNALALNIVDQKKKHVQGVSVGGITKISKIKCLRPYMNGPTSVAVAT